MYAGMLMTSSYNRIAGHSLERLAALSDGVFAVAMTLLVLDIRPPADTAVHSENDLWSVLIKLSPRILMFAMSFMTLGIFWVGQQTQLNHLARSDRSLSWMHLTFLAVVCVVPFSTAFLAEFMRFRVALLVYWLNLFLLGSVLYLSWVCATGSGLLKHDMPEDVPDAIKQRIVIAQSLYVVGVALCVFSTYWSIGFIVLVQLYYAVAPRIPRHARSEPAMHKSAPSS
jgi:uncharacterized membrane protein